MPIKARVLTVAMGMLIQSNAAVLLLRNMMMRRKDKELFLFLTFPRLCELHISILHNEPAAPVGYVVVPSNTSII